MARNWTPEERLKQAALTRRQKPWQHSTGPKTTEGKNAVKNNGWKHGLDSAGIAEIRRFLRLQRNFIKLVKARHGGKNMLD